MKFKHFLPALLFVAVLASQSACGSSESAVDKAARQSSSGALASSGPLEKYEKRASDLVFVTLATSVSKIGLGNPIMDASCLADELDAQDHDGTADAFTCSFKAVNGVVGGETYWEVDGPVATQLAISQESSTPTVTDSTPVNAYEATEQFRPFLYRTITAYEPGKEGDYFCEGPSAKDRGLFYCTFDSSFASVENMPEAFKRTIKRVAFADDGSVESFSEVSEIPANLSSPSADATTTTEAGPDLGDTMVCGSRNTKFEGVATEIKLDVTGAISCEQGWQAIDAALASGSETAPLGSTEEFKCDPPTSDEYGTTLGTCTARDGLARLTLNDITGLRENGYYD